MGANYFALSEDVSLHRAEHLILGSTGIEVQCRDCQRVELEVVMVGRPGWRAWWRIADLVPAVASLQPAILQAIGRRYPLRQLMDCRR
jgi:hypothetical protein